MSYETVLLIVVAVLCGMIPGYMIGYWHAAAKFASTRRK